MTTETAAPATATPETRPAPVEVTTPIRPSEAIRLGILKYPVATTGDTIEGDAACAIGAMLGGFGWDERGDGSSWSDSRLYAVLPKDIGGCPADPGCFWNTRQAGPESLHLGGPWALAHINDRHHWTREAIADWLRDEHGL